jgi:hypothetical protein
MREPKAASAGVPDSRRGTRPLAEPVEDSAGCQLGETVSKGPRSVSAEYVEVMKLAGDLAGKRGVLPSLEFPHHLWRSAKWK